MMSNKNEVFEYLIDQLRQQVGTNTYKQQCEDLAQEVQSLKNQLRDASALVAELQETIKLMNEDFNRATNHHGTLPKGASYVVGENGPEQSGFRKEGAQECEHSWIIMPGLFLSEGNPDNVPGSELCSKCGKREWDDAGYKQKNDTQECYHNWRFVNGKAPAVCVNCGVTKSSECEHEWQFYGVGFPCMCLKCGLKK